MSSEASHHDDSVIFRSWRLDQFIARQRDVRRQTVGTTVIRHEPDTSSAEVDVGIVHAEPRPSERDGPQSLAIQDVQHDRLRVATHGRQTKPFRLMRDGYGTATQRGDGRLRPLISISGKRGKKFLH